MAEAKIAGISSGIKMVRISLEGARTQVARCLLVVAPDAQQA